MPMTMATHIRLTRIPATIPDTHIIDPTERMPIDRTEHMPPIDPTCAPITIGTCTATGSSK